MLNLKKIRIRNYRSFVDEDVFFDDITAIVGPNEGGKTNILKAITHLNLKENKPFQRDDLRKGSKSYPDGEIEIQYQLVLNKWLIPELIREIPALEGLTFTITKKGKIEQSPQIECKIENYNGSEKIILIKKVPNFKQRFNEDELESLCDALQRKWFIKSDKINLSKTPFPQLKKSKEIEILDDKEKINKFLSDKIKDELRNNIQIYFWEYNKDDFLKNIISISEFISTPAKFNTARNLFKVAGWNINTDLTKNLTLLDQSDAAILLKTAANEINKLISKVWRQHRDLKVDIQKNGDDLMFHLQEINALTKPELRSDGLKWFLSFLINFRAKAENLSGFIILIDEPALHLHPRGQKDVLCEIKELAENNQVVYTTHQTFMIDKNYPDRVRILRRQSIKSEGADYYFASKITNEIDAKDITTDPLLREALGFKISDISSINDKNILVEGRFDRNLIYLLNEYFPNLDLDEYSVISCDGAPDIKKFANFLIANELKVFCLYDSDSAGILCHDNNSENGLDTKNKTHLKLLNKDFNNLETPEDLFGEELFLRCVKQVEELKNFKVDTKKPYLNQINEFLKNEGKSKEEKYIIKHDLEDILIKELRVELEAKEISLDSKLVKYLVSLVGKVKNL